MTQAPLLFTPSRPNLFVEAGAGTGKTTEIVRQVLEILLDQPGASPDRLVLITFTEKAAGEIAERIRDAMVDIHSALATGGDGWPSGAASSILRIPEGRREAWLRACDDHLAQLDRIRSQTIHSFCQSILARHPLEAGLDPSFRIAEGFERSRLLNEVWLEWLDDETSGDVAPERALEWEHALEGVENVFNLRQIVMQLVQFRGVIGSDSLAHSSFRDVAPAMRTAAGALRTLSDDESSVKDDDAAAFIAHVRASEPPPVDDAAAWLAWLEPAANHLRKAKLAGSAAVKAPLKVLRGAKKDENLYDLLVAERTASATLALARRFLDRLESEKDRRGILDFDDLLIRTERLLRDPKVAAEVRSRIDWLFVDEFQDTDSIQATIVRRLATNRAGLVENGRVVLVGDPKQSIYSFRGADPETYGETLNFFVAHGASQRHLTTQYRSRPALVRALNAMFARLFDREGDVNVFRPTYAPLDPGVAEDGDETPPIRFLALGPGVEGEAKTSDRQAAAVASFLKSRIDAGEPPETFAILVRKMTTIDPYLDALDSAGIEYVLPRNRSVLERRAAIDLLTVLRAVASPFDRGAIFSALRGPFFALGDDELAEALLARAAGEGAADSAFELARRQLKQWSELASRVTVEELVDAIVRESGIDVLYRLQARGAEHLEDLDAMVELAREFDREIGGALTLFVEEMLRRSEGGESVEPAIIEEGARGVRVMTVHASKGLEFDRVILPELACHMSSDRLAVFRLAEPDRVYLKGALTTIGTTAETIAGNRTPTEVLKERNEAENDRLFYVAVTRARREVVFVLDPLETVNRTFMKPLTRIFGFDMKALGDLFDSERTKVEEIGVGEEKIAAAFELVSPLPPTNEAPPRLVAPTLAGGIGDPLPRPEPEPEQAPFDRTELLRRAERMRYRRAGLLLHRVLEVWEGSAEPWPLLDALAAEVGANDLERDRVRRRLASVLASPSTIRIAGMRTVGRETTIWIEEEGRLREARIDRLLRDRGEWVVLDYKSGRSTPERLATDRAQVGSYCRAIAAMSGEPCRGLLWYIDLEGEEMVEVRGEDRGSRG